MSDDTEVTVDVERLTVRLADMLRAASAELVKLGAPDTTDTARQDAEILIGRWLEQGILRDIPATECGGDGSTFSTLRTRLTCRIRGHRLGGAIETGASMEDPIAETGHVHYRACCSRCRRLVRWTEGTS